MDKEIYITHIYYFSILKDFCWAGALQTLEKIEEKGKEVEFVDYLNTLIDELFNRKIEQTQLNDFIWFETEEIEYQLNCKLFDD